MNRRNIHNLKSRVMGKCKNLYLIYRVERGGYRVPKYLLLYTALGDKVLTQKPRSIIGFEGRVVGTYKLP